ncbi:uncharacterized protein LOC132717910 isoform X2 [Ruditapes philippinarum]|uniref:uncharacterized protein LOC132717910 isoform X2 n=1 Tax=Ruditapes philippinarum TaxID=129788 RepID=UPI00295B9769|nr:uncharacterized protein LOC132717910 isoform X2 [Ruditapes philippinarum]
MFPLEFTNVIARFENGYSVEIPVEKDKLRFNRPAKRKFRVNRKLLTELTNSQMKIDIDLQMKICSQFLRRCISNDVIIVFSGRKNREPSLQVVRYNFSKCQDYLEYFIQERRQLLLADMNITPKEYALNMIEIHTAEISKVMTLNYDDLPDASQNRHTLRKGKECLCQRIERCLSQVERTNII